MPKPRIIIDDPNHEIPGTTLNERLVKYHNQKIAYWAAHESDLLNTPCTIEKLFTRIKKVFHQKSR